jgi:16S rRNA (guanine966-N2)-methyltransferase
MRIIGGEAGGRRLVVPRGCTLRPTSDRIREALFSIIHPLSGRKLLDLFAGCGSVGLESLSRGAERVVFIERSGMLAAAIVKNARDCGLDGRAEILTSDAIQAISLLRMRGERFDVLFADPPYGGSLAQEALEGLDDGQLLADGGMVIVQHSEREALRESTYGALRKTDQRKYGDTLLSFYKIK